MIYLENLLETEVRNIEGNIVVKLDGVNIKNPVTAEPRLKLIELLCRTNPESVLARVISYDIPLDSTLEMVHQWKILDASAYLEYKLGRVAKAFEEFKQVT